MNELIKNTAFRKEFILGLILMLIVQIISFIEYWISLANFKNPPGVSIDMKWNFGFPFPIFYGADYHSFNQIDFVGLTVNLMIGIMLSFVIGLIIKSFRSKKAENDISLS